MATFSNAEISEFASQLLWLEEAVATALAALNVASEEYKLHKTKLESFLAEYYSEVEDAMGDTFTFAPSFTAARKEQDDNKGQLKFCVSAGERLEASTQIQPSKEEEEEGKLTIRMLAERRASRSIYRKLVKICHPDVVKSDPELGEFFPILSKAYDGNDIGTLVRLEQVFEGLTDASETEVERMTRMEERYQALLKAQDDVRLQHHQLLSSPEYQLMCKVERCKQEQGIDLLKVIKAELQKTLFPNAQTA